MDWKRLLSVRRVKSLMQDKPAGDQEDHRTEFERDYDRALFSTPVRRLQDKTQVFPLEPHDAVRTRLTHSHEVATVAHDLAAAVAPFLREQGLTPEQTDAIRTIARTCGLIHDLGNPPFGHAGEMAISGWFEDRAREALPSSGQEEGLGESPFFDRLEAARDYAGDFLSFEGNAQTIRLVARLQIFAHDYGLNLTCATLSAACKYVRSSAEPKPPKEKELHERSKVGYFLSEKDVIEKLRGEVGTGDARHPITYLVEAADDIVYSAVDLEDGLRKGLYTWRRLKRWLREQAERTGDLEEMDPLLDEDVPKLLKRVELEEDSRWYDEVHAKAFRTAVINRTVRSAVECFQLRYDSIMDGDYHGGLTEDSEFGRLVAICKKVGQKHVYNSSETLRLELRGRTVIYDLLDFFLEADGDADPRSFPGKVWDLLSPNYREVYKRSIGEHLPEGYCQLQLLTDYIAGMTDTFAIELHRRVKNGGVRSLH